MILYLCRQFSVLVIAGIAFVSMSQGQSKYKLDHYQIHVDNADSAVRASISYEQVNIVPRVNRHYWWFKNNRIQTTQGGYEGKLLDGTYVSLYHSGALKTKGRFERGEKRGRWFCWNEAGALTAVVVYKRNKQKQIFPSQRTHVKEKPKNETRTHKLRLFKREAQPPSSKPKSRKRDKK